LTGAITNSQTSFTIGNPSLFPPDGQFRIRIESELMLVTAVAGSSWTVTRGIEGTSAVSHDAGASIYGVLTVQSLLIATARISYALPIRLDYVSQTVLRLNTFGGRQAVNPLNGDNCDCVSVLATITNSGLLASTLYYVYFKLSDKTFTVSENGPDTTEGIDHYPADLAKLLVGWFFVDAAGLFAFDDQRSLVCSRHQQRQRELVAWPTADTYSADDTWHAANANTGGELWILQIPRNDMVRVAFQGTLSHSDGGAYVWLGVGFGTNVIASQPDDPNPDRDSRVTAKPDSATEQVSLSHSVPVTQPAGTTGAFGSLTYGYYNPTTSAFSNANSGFRAGSTYDGLLRGSLALPQSADLLRVTLTFTPPVATTSGPVAYPVSFKVYAELAINPTMPADIASAQAAALTVAYVQVTLTGTSQVTIDITPVIQEVVNQTLWQSGNFVVLHFVTDASTTTYVNNAALDSSAFATDGQRDSDCTVRRIGAFVRGELVSSSSTVTLYENDAAFDEFFPTMNAIVPY
jgi:hypothetical protein